METSVLHREGERVAAVYARRKQIVPHDRYSCLNLGNLLNDQELERAVLDVVRMYAINLSQSHILDVGCGDGGWIREFIRHGARPENITGIDILPDRIAIARDLCPSRVTLKTTNAAEMGLPDASFDLVLQSTVFSSVLDASIRGRIASEMLRVTRKGGVILWYDFFVDNPGNHDAIGIRRREISGLFNGCSIHAKRLTLLPPLARFLGPRTPTLLRFLASTKLLSTHYLAVIRRSNDN